MSTPNFYQRNANRIYAVLMDNETEQFEVDDLIENVIAIVSERLEANDKYEIRSINESLDYNRSYPQYGLCTVETSEEFETPYFEENPYISIALMATLNSGYYAGGTLDYEYEFANSEENDFQDIEYMIIDELESLMDFEDVQLTDAQYNELKERMVDWANKELGQLEDKLEAIYEQIAEEKLVCTAVFSNGEAMYSRVSK